MAGGSLFEIMIPNNEPPAIVVPPSGSFTTPAPPRGAAPWPTATQRLSFFYVANFPSIALRAICLAHRNSRIVDDSNCGLPFEV